MSAYQPFLISGFKTGLNTDVATWLLPPDAFPTLENAYLKDGVINKRSGSQFFAQFVDNVGNTTNQITGIYEYVGLDSGSKVTELLFTDTKRMCRYNAVTELCEAIDVADIFSSSNYKWFANFGITGSVTQNRLFITDNNPTGAPPATARRTCGRESAHPGTLRCRPPGDGPEVAGIPQPAGECRPHRPGARRRAATGTCRTIPTPACPIPVKIPRAAGR